MSYCRWSSDDWQCDASTVRNEALSEVGRSLQALAAARFDKYGPNDCRGAALWDAATHVVETMGDGDWRNPEVATDE